MKHLIFSISLLTLFACKEATPVPDPPPKTPYGEFIDDFTFRVTPKGGNNFDHAEFRLWVPEGIDELRAVLVLCNSHNGSALGLTAVDAWREFARAEEVGLLGVYFRSDPGTDYYGIASGGSGDALLRSLDSIATKNGIQTIKDLPFLMRGYSAGGVFSHSFSGFMPERVIAFANIRGGGVTSSGPGNNHIPGIMFMGENDEPSRNNRIKGAVNENRDEGGLWAFATEPGVDHFGSLGNSDELIRAFFAAALAKRVSGETHQLDSIPENAGWLGDNVTKEVFPFDSFPGTQCEASWLIDEDVAKGWKRFQGK